jgi:hypothetical protein
MVVQSLAMVSGLTFLRNYRTYRASPLDDNYRRAHTR